MSRQFAPITCSRSFSGGNVALTITVTDDRLSEEAVDRLLTRWMQKIETTVVPRMNELSHVSSCSSSLAGPVRATQESTITDPATGNSVKVKVTMLSTRGIKFTELAGVASNLLGNLHLTVNDVDDAVTPITRSKSSSIEHLLGGLFGGNPRVTVVTDPDEIANLMENLSGGTMPFAFGSPYGTSGQNGDMG